MTSYTPVEHARDAMGGVTFRNPEIQWWGSDTTSSTRPPTHSHLPQSFSMLDDRVESPRAVGQEVL